MIKTKLVNVLFLLFIWSLYVDTNLYINSQKANLSTFNKYAQLSGDIYDWKYDTKNYEKIGEGYSKKKKALGFVLKAKKLSNGLTTYVVVFRGTLLKSFRNLKTDLDARKSKNIFCNKCYVHKGIYKHFLSIRDSLEKLLIENINKLSDKNKVKIVVTGHSLGGATAIYYADYFANKYPQFKNKIYLYTFGSPRTGNELFVNWTNKLLGKQNIFRVEYKNDPVTFLPPKRWGFMHIGGGAYLYSNDRQFKFESPYDMERFSPKWLIKHPKNLKDHREYFNIVKS